MLTECLKLWVSQLPSLMQDMGLRIIVYTWANYLNFLTLRLCFFNEDYNISKQKHVEVNNVINGKPHSAMYT
jgi:hypothetical protein